MSYAAEVLADSICDGDRLITVQVTFPRFILAEVNTHRVFSRNSASSRAIPPEKHIERILDEAFVPDVFCQRVKGMGQGQPVEDQDHALNAWLDARDFAVRQARILIDLDVAKSHVNRLLEPFMWHTAIISATEWENFFALRCPVGDEVDLAFPAQPEFQWTAIKMRTAMRASEPTELGKDEWHLPLVDAEARRIARESSEQEPTWDASRWLCLVSAGRCARVSFDRAGETEEPLQSYNRAERLLDSGHLSPFEHQATPDFEFDRGNFNGWRQFRYGIPSEHNRVGKLEERAGWEVVPA